MTNAIWSALGGRIAIKDGQLVLVAQGAADYNHQNWIALPLTREASDKLAACIDHVLSGFGDPNPDFEPCEDVVDSQAGDEVAGPITKVKMDFGSFGERDRVKRAAAPAIVAAGKAPPRTPVNVTLPLFIPIKSSQYPTSTIMLFPAIQLMLTKFKRNKS